MRRKRETNFISLFIFQVHSTDIIFFFRGQFFFLRYRIASMGAKTLKIKINKDFTELEKAFSPIDRLYEHVHLYQTQMSTAFLMKCIITVRNI